jgi:hypothetical protein
LQIRAISVVVIVIAAAFAAFVTAAFAAVSSDLERQQSERIRDRPSRGVPISNSPLTHHIDAPSWLDIQHSFECKYAPLNAKHTMENVSPIVSPTKIPTDFNIRI